jgi:hypothetical protein
MNQWMISLGILSVLLSSNAYPSDFKSKVRCRISMILSWGFPCCGRYQCFRDPCCFHLQGEVGRDGKKWHRYRTVVGLFGYLVIWRRASTAQVLWSWMRGQLQRANVKGCERKRWWPTSKCCFSISMSALIFEPGTSRICSLATLCYKDDFLLMDKVQDSASRVHFWSVPLEEMFYRPHTGSISATVTWLSVSIKINFTLYGLCVSCIFVPLYVPLWKLCGELYEKLK